MTREKLLLAMNEQSTIIEFQRSLEQIFDQLFDWRSIAIIVGISVIAFVINKMLGKLLGYFLRFIIKRSEQVDNDELLMRYRRAETSANIALAIIQLLVIAIAFYVIWRLLDPSAAPIAAIGASALFVVLASATVGPLLRDLTSGSAMIAERWYGVGDYVTVEPFKDIKGVVEKMSLRSTKLRGLSGEVLWVHNQHIQAVRVKYRGTSTIAMDLFVSDKDRAEKLIKDIIRIVPKGPTLVIGGLKLAETEELNHNLWRMSLHGTTVPGREWLIEDFATAAVKDADELEGKKKIIVYGPITRYVDSAAERRYRRSIRS